MRNTFRLNTRGVARVDLQMLLAIVMLTVFGLVMILSASGYICATSKLYNYDMYYLVKKQLGWSAVGIVLMLVVARVDYRVWAPLAPLAYLFAIAIIFMLKLPESFVVHGITRDEATRWLAIGPMSFQVADAVKLALVVFFAWFPCRFSKMMNYTAGVIPVWILGGIVALLIYEISQNLSTAIIILGMTVLVSYISSRKTWLFVLFGLLGVGVITYIVWGIWSDMPTGSELAELPFRVKRIVAWLDPFNPEYMSSISYQIVQSLYAVGRGGLTGVGLGNSIQKMGSIPEAQNDMIFAIVMEELGVLGAGVILLLFGYLIYQLFAVAVRAQDKFGRLLVAGVMVHLSLQVLLNIAVTLNLIPNTGVSMPFFSSGGTSAVFLYFELGLAFSVWRTGVAMKQDERKQKEQEHSQKHKLNSEKD
ncbi:MAG: cell division protein FtsW [Lachnospiraceae bacterium]|nr:cell division protein FtsW [Lachnospiraceae bacterium]